MKPILLTILLATLSAPVCLGEWTRVVEGENGTTSYIDFERIREHEGYVHFWELTDFTKPLPDGALSSKVYTQGDCDQFRYRLLNTSFYPQPMGKGDPDVENKPEKNWTYPHPDFIGEIILKTVCDFVKSK